MQEHENDTDKFAPDLSHDLSEALFFMTLQPVYQGSILCIFKICFYIK